ncbi:hypothetical protein PybrP1_005102 [[Pythium] brassicae (nom. inval.)]|nr:hypothetical protein PybrP1_005102 [[Pythium] brassicae (nom. inval.)]
MHHLLKIRAFAPTVATASKRSSRAALTPAAHRAFRSTVQQGAIRASQRYPRPESDPRRFFERSWTLSGQSQLERLKLRMPGVAFVSVADPQEEEEDGGVGNGDWIARIRVTSDSPEALASIAVETRRCHRAAVFFAPAWSHQVPARGNLLTEIVLPRGWGEAGGMLRSLATTGEGLVVVEDDVLAMHADPNAVVKLAAAHGSRLAVTATRDVDVSKLQIAAAALGRVDLRAPNVVVSGKLDVAGAGAGSVHVQSLGYLRSPQLSVAIAGDGRVCVHAAERLTVERMRSVIAGAGSISVSVADRGGSSKDPAAAASRLSAVVACKSHHIGVVGSGSVRCADVATQQVAVGVAGHAHVVVDATEELKVVSIGTACVQYPREAPSVAARGGWHSSEPHEVATVALTDAEKSAEERQREAELEEAAAFWRALPTRAAALEAAHQVSFAGEWDESRSDRRWPGFWSSGSVRARSSVGSWGQAPWYSRSWGGKSWRRRSWPNRA